MAQATKAENADVRDHDLEADAVTAAFLDSKPIARPGPLRPDPRREEFAARFMASMLSGMSFELSISELGPRETMSAVASRSLAAADALIERLAGE